MFDANPCFKRLLFSLLNLWIFLFGSADAQTLFKDAQLILGDGSRLERGSVLIDGDRIVAIGDAAELKARAGEVLDMSGMTILPALIDGHAHLGYQGSVSWGAENYTRDNLIENLQRYSWYGFGAVFSAGSDPIELIGQLQAELAAGEFVGALPLAAVGMAPPGQGPNNRFLAEVAQVEARLQTQILFGLSSEAQARQAAREQLQRGAEYLKLWVDDRGGTQDKLSPVIVAAVVDEVDKQAGGDRDERALVFVHQQFAADMPALLAGQVDGFLHGRLGAGFDLPLALAVSVARSFIVPNLGLAELRREAIAEDAFLQATQQPAALMGLGVGDSGRSMTPAADPQQDRAVSASLGHLLESGVDIVLGTDAGAVPGHPFGYTGHRELEIFVRLGMTPMQALQSATEVAARRLGLDDRGRLEAGLRADLLILSADPLEDIRNTRRIHAVYLGGKAVDRDGLAHAWMQPD